MAAEKFGTPVYVYDASTIVARYHRLKTAFKGQPVSIFYACKALTNINILKLLEQEGCNIDCSSINEVRIALKAGFAPERTLYTSNGIGFDEIEEAAALGVHINIDSLSNLYKFGQKHGGNYPVGIRIRPNIMAGGHLKIATGHDKSKFGIPVEHIDEILKILEKTGLRIKGIHLHSGSDIKDVEVFLKMTSVVFHLLPLFPNIEVVDLGGGFKVPYSEAEQGTDIDLLAKKTKEIFEGKTNSAGRPLEVWFEPGKFIVSEAGHLVTKVTVLKETPGTVFASIDSGFNHLIRPMFYDAYHTITNLSNPDGPLTDYTVVGNLCETDTFATDRALPMTQEGDLLSFSNAGAYGYEMASVFNARPRPAEVLVKDGECLLIRKRDTLDDLIANQISVL